MTIQILSKDNDLLGTDIYRESDKTNPMAFRPTIVMSVNPNTSGSNHNVAVKTSVPVVKDVAGVVTSSDSFLMVTKFSALQHISNDVERAKCFDDHIKFLGKARTAILDGQLPDAPINMATA